MFSSSLSRYVEVSLQAKSREAKLQSELERFRYTVEEKEGLVDELKNR